MSEVVRITGSGSYTPENKISTEQLLELLDANTKQRRIASSLKIDTRAFESPIDPKTGLPEWRTDEVALAQSVAEEALVDAEITIDDVDLLEFVSCTQNQEADSHFSKTVMRLHNKLGLADECDPFEMDAGCGGFGTALSRAVNLLHGSDRDVALVVASNVTSRHYDASLYKKTKHAWLSTLVFGDGAGAVVLQKQKQTGREGITAHCTAVESDKNLMEYRASEAVNKAVYEIQASVKDTYSMLMKKSLRGISNELGKSPDQVLKSADWIFCHQANARLLDGLVEELGVSKAKVPKNVDTEGNLAAATVPVLFDEADMSRGDSWLILVVGAGAQLASAYGTV
jgi:3-oxoacyl-[acyl-carrier-protein] synthase-3